MKTCRDTGVPLYGRNIGRICGSDGRGRVLTLVKRCRCCGGGADGQRAGSFPWEPAWERAEGGSAPGAADLGRREVKAAVLPFTQTGLKR